MTKEAGLCVQAFMIIGTPDETEETLEKTFEFIQELDPDFFDFNITYPMPGTELYQTGLEEGLFREEVLPHGSYADGIISSRALSNERLTEWRKDSLLKLSLRPKYIARTLWRARSPNRIAHYVRAGLFRLKSLTAN